jgi:hypothetical protein
MDAAVRRNYPYPSAGVARWWAESDNGRRSWWVPGRADRHARRRPVVSGRQRLGKGDNNGPSRCVSPGIPARSISPEVSTGRTRWTSLDAASVRIDAPGLDPDRHHRPPGRRVAFRRPDRSPGAGSDPGGGAEAHRWTLRPASYPFPRRALVRWWRRTARCSVPGGRRFGADHHARRRPACWASTTRREETTAGSSSSGSSWSDAERWLDGWRRLPERRRAQGGTSQRCRVQPS